MSNSEVMVCRGGLAPPLALWFLGASSPLPQTSTLSHRPPVHPSITPVHFFLGGKVEDEGWSDSRTNSLGLWRFRVRDGWVFNPNVSGPLQPTNLKCWNLREYLELRPNNFKITPLVTFTPVTLTFWLYAKFLTLCEIYCKVLLYVL